MPPRAKKPASTAKKPSKAKPSSQVAGSKRAHNSDSESDTAGSPSKKTKTNVGDDQNMVTVLKRGAAPVDPHSGYICVSINFKTLLLCFDALPA